MIDHKGGEMLGTCCAAHLAAKVRDYAPDAENGAVTVTVIENPSNSLRCNFIIDPDRPHPDAVWCTSLAEFKVSYYPKGGRTRLMTMTHMTPEEVRAAGLPEHVDKKV